MGAFRECDIRPYGLFECARASVHKGRGSFAVSTPRINYTDEGQSVGGPYTVLSLNNCLLEHRSVYGRVARAITLSHPNTPIAH